MGLDDESQSQSVVAHAYAKVNLTLDVLGKRPDGYHDIASVMQAVSLHDTLFVSARTAPGVSLDCGGPTAAGVPHGEGNLVWLAANAVLQCAGKPDAGVAIHLTKTIPARAGLGGGSSDAASAILAVERLLGVDTGRQRIEIAAALGADVPFFLSGATAVVRGRGEIVTPLASTPAYWLVIVKPDISVSTAWAYDYLDASPGRVSFHATDRMVEALAASDWRRATSLLCNDFELPVFEAHPQLAWLQDEMNMAGVLGARLCGSGSALFGVAADRAGAERAALALGRRYAQVYIAETLGRAQSSQVVEVKEAGR